jgi:hypothetical protein
MLTFPGSSYDLIPAVKSPNIGSKKRAIDWFVLRYSGAFSISI